jgi:apolipoprotein D and lipocalin family protein
MKKEHWLLTLAAGVGVAAVAGVTYNLLSKDIPKGATAVQPFDKERYLGLWYEIARLPNSIEKNISKLTELYSLNDDGTMQVITKGYNYKKDKWTEIEGKIKFAGSEDIGMLKVSYFGPAYANYNVLAIDENYKYALVSGSGLDFLWLLSKEQAIPENIKTQFIDKAKSIGFAVEKLEWPEIAA